MSNRARFLLVAMAVAVAAPAALAQTVPAAPAAPNDASAAATPERTSAAFGDWVYRCESGASGATTTRLCEVAQIIEVQGRQAPRAEIALARVAPNAPFVLTIALPPNIDVANPVSAVVDVAARNAIPLTWRRCIGRICFADATVGEDMVKFMLTRSEAGRIAYKDGKGRDVAVAFSFRGFPQALDALLTH